MANKELKKIMTDFAAGHISKEKADVLMEDIKVSENGPVSEPIDQEEKDMTKNTQKRKLNAKGGKK
jgi:hypothetical protein